MGGGGGGGISALFGTKTFAKISLEPKRMLSSVRGISK